MYIRQPKSSSEPVHQRQPREQSESSKIRRPNSKNEPFFINHLNKNLMKSATQQAVKMYAKAMEDFQAQRIAMNNRIGKKANGETQNIDTRSFEAGDIDNFINIAEQAEKQEHAIEKMLKKALKKFPVYNEFLAHVKGIGEVSAAWIIGSFDIEKATTVSKMWQYAGYNPGMVRGKKRVSKKKYKPEMGEIISEVKNIKDNSTDLIIQTDELIRGDRAIEGFVLPFNRELRTKLFVMAEGFIKQQNQYALEFYYPYKNRLENETRNIINDGKARKGDGDPWCEANKLRRHLAAMRYMNKQFLKDLYNAWREIEGLPIRPPYAEEYLGKKHE